MYYFGYLHYKIVVICTNNTICIITKFKAHRWHSRGRWFDPLRLHHKKAITMQVLMTAWFFIVRIYIIKYVIFCLDKCTIIVGGFLQDIKYTTQIIICMNCSERYSRKPSEKYRKDWQR